MPQAPAITRFRKLVNEISRLYGNARSAQVRFAWETGRRLVQEEQNGAMRAVYRNGLILEVSKILSEKFGPGFSVTNLKYMRQFYLSNPIGQISGQLDWSDYVEMLRVKDRKTRKRLEQRVLKEDLTTAELRSIVRDIREAPAPKVAPSLPPLKHPTGLKLHTFSISPLRAKLKDGQVLIDCGFFASWPVMKDEVKNLNIVEEMSYTYLALIDRVIDGDTLHVLIEAGFGIIVHDRLRLRGVNTPELGTPEGDRAKRFVEKLLPAGSTVVIKSHKWRTDTHGRFVVDVLYNEGIDDPAKIIQEGVYLNQELLDQGHAVRAEE